MNPTELTRSIIATRSELSDAMRRNPYNIYRRMPQAAQDAWDELGLPPVLMIMLPRQIINVIENKVARMTEGGGE